MKISKVLLSSWIFSAIIRDLCNDLPLWASGWQDYALSVSISVVLHFPIYVFSTCLYKYCYIVKICYQEILIYLHIILDESSTVHGVKVLIILDVLLFTQCQVFITQTEWTGRTFQGPQFLFFYYYFFLFEDRKLFHLEWILVQNIVRLSECEPCHLINCRQPHS